MTNFYSREQIGYDPPITGPAPTGQEANVVFHWPGSRLVPTTHDGMMRWLREMQVSYKNGRGYSLGYGWIIGDHGVYEGRGTQFRNAANAGKKTPINYNHVSRSVLIAYPIDGQVSQAMTQNIHALLREFNMGTWPQKAHSDVDWTACCGDPARARIASGAFVPPPNPPEPVPPPGDDDAMLVNLVREKGGPFWFQQWSNGTKTWIADPATLTLIQELNPGIGMVELPNDAWMNATGVVVGPKPPDTDGWGKRTR